MTGASTRLRRVRPGRLVIAVLTIGGGSACSGGDDTSSTTTTSFTTSVPVVEVPAVALTESYFAALARLPAADPGVPIGAVPGSDAAVFAQHQEAARRLLGLLSPRTAEPALDGFLVCEADGGCSTYSGVVTEPASGLLTSFSVDGSPLAGRIVGSGSSAQRDGIVVRVSSAYATVSGDLFVVLDVENTAEFAVELFGFAAVLRPTVPGGTSAGVEATGAWGTTAVLADGIGEMMLMFPSSALGGVLQLSGLRGDGLDVLFDVAVPIP